MDKLEKVSVTVRPPDWQLPTGVDHGLWDYLHNPNVAHGYDASLTGSTLFVADERFVAKHCPKPGWLIDLGCGTGRLLLTFAQRGYRVLGVDLSASMLTVAKEKAEASNIPINLLQANLADLNVIADKSFDYAACLFSTLGMVAGEEARRQVIAHAFRVLRPGGCFLLHVHNLWFNAFDPPGRRWLLKNLLAAAIGRTRSGDREMPVHQDVVGLTLHHFTRTEVIRLLQSAGFRIVEVETLGLSEDGKLKWPNWLGWLRAYGYLLAAEKP